MSSVYLPALLAALHHLAAFTLVATLAIEVALVRPPLSLFQAHRLQRVDLIFGVSAVVLLCVGLARVTWYEKGPAYYWHDIYFLVKFCVFLGAAVISIYPTITFLSWTRLLRAGDAPSMREEQTRRVRLCLMLEPSAIVIILPCAALMARGFGFLHWFFCVHARRRCGNAAAARYGSACRKRFASSRALVCSQIGAFFLARPCPVPAP